VAVRSGVVADESALSVAARCAFARVAAFAACGVVPSAVFAVHWCFSWPLADDLFPAVAVASGVPDFVWQPGCFVVADISGPLQACRWLEPCNCGAELHWHERWGLRVRRCCLLDELH